MMKQQHSEHKINKWMAVILLIPFILQGYFIFFLLNNFLVYAIFAHVATALLFPWPLWKLMPRKFRQSFAVLGLLFLWCLLIPVVSGLGLLLTLTIGSYYAKPLIEDVSNTIEAPRLPEHLLQRVSLSQYEVGESILTILETSEIEDLRIKAVLTTRQMADREAIPILRVALLDPVDEVRLLAYSMLDKKEKNIDRLIHKNLKQIKTTEQSKQVALHRSLAESYWELSFLGLVRGQAKIHILTNAYRHIQKVIKSQQDAEACFLKARISLALDLYVIAKKSLDQAEALGMAKIKLAPYQAELAFVTRHFDEVATYMSSVYNNETNSKMLDLVEVSEIVSGIIEQWD